MPAMAEMPGLHAGAIVFIGIAAANVGNYAFHLITARALGPSDYGEVASLIALAGLISLPLGGVQVIVARRIAAAAAADRSSEIARFARRAAMLAALSGAGFAALLMLASPMLARVLDIESTAAVMLTGALAAPAFLTPALWGVAQGLQRFWALALSMALSPLFRIVLIASLLAAGFGVAGAMAATLVAALLGIAVPAWALKSWLARRSGSAEAHRRPTSNAREFAPVVLGLLAITSLTTTDVIFAKAVLDDDVAGIYASASLVGRVILYVPAAVITVLLPKVSSRVASGRDSSTILAGSIVITAAFCAVATLGYTLGPSLVTLIAFGSGFEDVTGLLPLFAVSMSGFALLNVLLAYHLGHGSARMPLLLAGGALAQLLGFTLFNESPRQLLAVSTCVGVGLLIAHELYIERTFVGTVRVLARLARQRRS